MDPTRFELSISVPRDERFAVTVRGLAVHAAQYAGCPAPAAEAFGQRVEEAILAQVEESSAGAVVPVVVRREAGPVEVLVDAQTISVDV